MATSKNKVKIKTPTFKSRFVSVFETSSNEMDKGKYALTWVFPPGSNMTRLTNAIDFIIAQEGINPAAFESPLRPQDKDWCDFTGEENAYYCRSRSKFQPKIVDQNFKPILKPEDFPEGVLAECLGHAYSWEQYGRRGISFSLGTIRRLQNPDEVNTEYYSPMSPADEFAQFDDDSD